CAAAFLLVLYRSAQDRLGYDPAAALVSVLSLAAAPGFVVWSTSGLETLPAALLLYLVVHHWLLGDEPEDARRGRLAALGLAVFRTEGVLWVLVLAGLAALRRRLEGDRAGRLDRAVAVVLAASAAYFAARYAWFGTALANTAAAKV